jgi:polyhydroxyalkanoate synthesis regulator phasin
MGEPASSLRETVERLLFAGVGAVVLTAERGDQLAEALAEHGMLRRDEARQLADELAARWRGDASRFGERAGEGLRGVFAAIGLVARDEFEELELRVAQLEHRLRLVERDAAPASPATRTGPPTVRPPVAD